jgi:beta-glucosidase
MKWIVSALTLSATFVFAQGIPAVTGDARVDKLLSEMTLEEKLMLIHGTPEDPAAYQGQAGYLGGVPRLGIPGMRFADGPPGVLTRNPSQGESATMAVAATFSRATAEANGVVIGREDRALGIDVSLQPFVNLDRDLEFRRSYNTFGEDPFLTSEIGAAEIEGIQSQHVMAEVKHFVAYDSGSGNIFVDDQALHEVYLAPFEAAIHAGVAAIMCSYNRINGVFACGNPSTLTQILRNELGFKGFVTSDWSAVHAVNFISAGLDVEMPGEQAPSDKRFRPSFFDLQPAQSQPEQHTDASSASNDPFAGHLPEEPPRVSRPAGDIGLVLNPEKIAEALRDGTVTEATIDRAAGHVLYEMIRFGYLDGLSKHSITTQSIQANARIIERTGEEAAVLLKNENHALPLNPSHLDSVVLIGPTAAQVDSIGISGERSIGLPERQVGPLEALKKISGNSRIRFAVGEDMTGTTVPVEVLSHDDKPGLVRSEEGNTSVDAQIDLTGKHALASNTTAVWKGSIAIARSGVYWFYLQVMGADASFTIDGKRLAGTGASQGSKHGDTLQANEDNIVPTPDGLDNVRRAVALTAGTHSLEVRVAPDGSDAPVQVRFNWYTPEQRQIDHMAAIQAARNAHTAVVFAWARTAPVFGLPGEQDQLIDDVASVNPNTIVVLNTSQPVAMPWLNKVKAVLEMWWPGDEGGWATANVLLGKVSPAGRLPVTWAKHLEDYPVSDPRYPERTGNGVNRKTTYSEGVYVGYRWFDKENVDPLFPFGYGLSYSKFTYSQLKVDRTSDGGLQVTFIMQNTGAVPADEVPQAYLSAPSDIPQGVQFPVRALVAFNRVHLAAGERKAVTLRVSPRQLQYWSTQDQKWLLAKGKRTLSVGASSRDLRLQTVIDLASHFGGVD